MKQLLVLFLLTISTYGLSAPKVLWWNIGYNEYSLPSTVNKQQTQLDDTLQSYNWQKYDIVALGEYIEGTLNQNSLNKLKSYFPYQKVINYNDAYGKSIFIFSKTSFDSRVFKLDWADPSISKDSQNRYKEKLVAEYGNMDTFMRKYIRISTRILDEDYNFIFYHLNNPWPKFYKKIGKIRTATEIIFGRNNPLYNQILNIKKNLEDDFGANYKDENIIMMGDSNCPQNVKGISSSCYEVLDEILDVVVDKEDLVTFPARNSKVFKKFPSVKIDHAQVSPGLIGKTTTKVMRLIGSDHYPIELTIF